VTYHYLADTYLADVNSSLGSDSPALYELGYDALGRTVRRTFNGQRTYFVYDGARSILEFGGSGTMSASTLYGLGQDEILKRNNNGAGQFLLQDRMGSTVAVTGWKGELLEQYRYDAFGTPTIMAPDGSVLTDSAINNRFLFVGREWVSRFGFYENRARAYHPELGRFMSEDPIGFAAGDTNLYRYCNNDPVNHRDPSGKDADVEQEGANVRIALTLHYTGQMFGNGVPAGAASAFNNGIINLIGGEHGGYNVQIVLGQGPSNTVTVYSGRGISQTVIGGSHRDTWYFKAEANPGYIAAHETLHILGLEDLYKKDATGKAIYDKNGKHVPIRDDIDPNNIMVGNGWTLITKEQIEQIIAFNQRSAFGRFWRELAKAISDFGQMSNGDPGCYYAGTIYASYSQAAAVAAWDRMYGTRGFSLH
jgi:RHS repeat-associated protein